MHRRCPARECHSPHKCKGNLVRAKLLDGGHLEDCIKMCNNNPLCKWYTLEKSNDHCLLYKDCEESFSCETCATGPRYCSRGYHGITDEIRNKKLRGYNYWTDNHGFYKHEIIKINTRPTLYTVGKYPGTLGKDDKCDGRWANGQIGPVGKCHCMFEEWTLCGTDRCMHCGNCADKENGWQECSDDGVNWDTNWRNIKECPNRSGNWKKPGPSKPNEFKRRWGGFLNTQRLLARVCRTIERGTNPCTC